MGCTGKSFILRVLGLQGENLKDFEVSRLWAVAVLRAVQGSRFES